MSLAVKQAVNRLLGKFGYHLAKGVAGHEPIRFPDDFDEADKVLCDTIRFYTMTGPPRVYSLRRAVEYIAKKNIPGDVVECGVWKGGSALAIALTLLKCGDTSRDLYLYDTYDEGWPDAGPDDVLLDGTTAHELWEQAVERGETPEKLFGKVDQVREVLNSSGYPAEKIHLVKGKVENTIPGVAPEQIALLRLDTDWYDSTKHELEHLYDRLVPGGILMLDDYGSWKGARKAADEFFAKNDIHLLLHRTDDTGYRVAIKT